MVDNNGKVIATTNVEGYIMVLSILKRSKPEKRQQMVDVQEAFYLWDILNSKYLALESLKTYKNDTHDVDLRKIIDITTKALEKNIKIFENELQKYSIQAPDRNRAFINFPQNTQAVTDEYIANHLFLFFQEEVEHFLKAYRSCVTNDSVRTLIKNLSLEKIDITDRIVCYLRLKNWLNIPPLYKNTPQNVKEEIATIEIGNLWDHLTFRYDNVHTTEVIRSFARDPDFILTLDMGLKVLEGQVEMLEKELQYFGVPLPKRPGKVTMTPSSTEILFDDHMFRTLLNGIQGATILHIQPLKQCIFNERIRGVFKNLLLEEIGLIDRYFKYGKLKGWFHPSPLYGG